MLNFFPIDNPKGQADPTFSRLLAAIEHTVRAESYVHRRVPIAWYRTYDELQRVLAEGRPTVSFAETVQLASRSGMPADPRNSVEKEAQALLRFLHELGILMYFNEPGLDDIVVLDPQWLPPLERARQAAQESALPEAAQGEFGSVLVQSSDAVLLGDEEHKELLEEVDSFRNYNLHCSRS